MELKNQHISPCTRNIKAEQKPGETLAQNALNEHDLAPHGHQTKAIFV